MSSISSQNPSNFALGRKGIWFGCGEPWGICDSWFGGTYAYCGEQPKALLGKGLYEMSVVCGGGVLYADA
jgi:hypothetical protein